MDQKLAYFLGVLQTDGKLTTYKTRKRNKFYDRTDIGLNVGEKSLPMLLAFQRILREVYDRDVTIHRLKRGTLDLHTSVNKLLENFKQNGIAKNGIPNWIMNSKENFGAYLAGIIDGDGDIRVKGPKFTDYLIRVTSGQTNEKLIELAKRIMCCGVHITKRSGTSVFKDGRKVEGKWYEIEFSISKKNVLFIKDYVLPLVQIIHKKNLMRKGVNEKLKLLKSIKKDSGAFQHI